MLGCRTFFFHVHLHIAVDHAMVLFPNILKLRQTPADDSVHHKIPQCMTSESSLAVDCSAARCTAASNLKGTYRSDAPIRKLVCVSLAGLRSVPATPGVAGAVIVATLACTALYAGTTFALTMFSESVTVTP